MNQERASDLLRPFLVYLICLPLALLVGYFFASPDWMYSWGVTAVVLLLLTVPILLRVHHWVLLVAWNSSVTFYLLHGLQFWIVAGAISLLFAIGQRTVDARFRFLSVREITRPIIFFFFVVFLTAEATGGI